MSRGGFTSNGIILISAGGGFGTPALLQSIDGHTLAAGTVQATLGSNVASGSLIIGMCSDYDARDTVAQASTDFFKASGTATIGAVALNRYDLVSQDGIPVFTKLSTFSCIVTGAGSLTMEYDSTQPGFSSELQVAMLEFSGTWSGSRYETGNFGSQDVNNTTPIDSGPATSAGAALFLGHNYTRADSFTDTVEAGWTDIPLFFSGGRFIYRNVSVGTTDNALWNLTSIVNLQRWVAQVAVYKQG